jgi:hypothetical protein
MYNFSNLLQNFITNTNILSISVIINEEWKSDVEN